MHATEPTQPVYKLVCTAHGILTEEPQDHIAATLVRDEHLENCPADIEIFDPDEQNAFERAKDVAVDGGSSQHCPDCLRRLDDADVCPRCGNS